MTAPNIPELRRLLARPLATFSDADRYDLIVALRNDVPALLDLLDDMAEAGDRLLPDTIDADNPAHVRWNEAWERYDAMKGAT